MKSYGFWKPRKDSIHYDSSFDGQSKIKDTIKTNDSKKYTASIESELNKSKNEYLNLVNLIIEEKKENEL